MHSHIGCICMTFPHCVFSNVSSNCQLRGCIVTLVALVWLFSTVRFQMFPQRDSLDWCKVTLVALVWIFSTVCFKMPASENVKSHWSHFFNFSPCLKTFSHDIYSLCVFNIFSNRLSLCMQSHIGCIYSTCPHVWKTKMLSCGDKSYI